MWTHTADEEARSRTCDGADLEPEALRRRRRQQRERGASQHGDSCGGGQRRERRLGQLRAGQLLRQLQRVRRRAAQPVREQRQRA